MKDDTCYTISSASVHGDNWLCFNDFCPFVSECENERCMNKQRAMGKCYWCCGQPGPEGCVDTSWVPEWRSGSFMSSLYLYCTGLILDGKYINSTKEEVEDDYKQHHRI